MIGWLLLWDCGTISWWKDGVDKATPSWPGSEGKRKNGVSLGSSRAHSCGLKTCHFAPLLQVPLPSNSAESGAMTQGL